MHVLYSWVTQGKWSDNFIPLSLLLKILPSLAPEGISGHLECLIPFPLPPAAFFLGL